MDAVEPGGLGGTFGGNPVACAAGIAVLDEVATTAFRTRAEQIGERLRARLDAIAERMPQVGEVRGLGPMLALELVRDPDTKEPAPELALATTTGARERGLILLTCGLYGNVVRILVPLVASDEELDRGLDLLEESLVDACAAAASSRRRGRPADVEVVSAYKSYGDVAAVNGVDLLVRAGEFFTMLGPSGSGKTTTLRLIAGFEQPDCGRDPARRRRRDARAAVRARRQHGVPGLRALPAHDRRGQRRVRPAGEEGPAAGAPAEGRRGARHGAARAASATGDPGSSRAASGSGSRSRGRSSTARRVLLLDEPLGALDLKLRQQMQIELKRIQEEVGITFIYVTHDQEEALTMSDRLAVFNEGRIEQVGPPAAVYEHPESEFVAGFVGVSNVLERTLNGQPSRFTVRPEKIRLLAEGRHGRPGANVEDGRIRDVVYVGMVTRYVVDLDAGGRADGRAPEPGDVLERGARGPGPPRAPGVAARAHLRNRTGGRDGGGADE